jgi:hypothetical protein
MSDWQKDLTAAWEAIVGISEEFNAILQAAATEVSQAVAIELELISTEIKELQEEVMRSGWLDEIVDSQTQVFNFFNDLENTDDWPTYYEPKQEASPTFQPACQGCHNYNGTTFGGNLLVCGLHPYGWDGASCPDWEEDHPTNHS